jgi:hypothetical protein
VACREGKLPELTERDTEAEGVREAMTVPASQDVPSVRGKKEERRDDVANVGPRMRRRAQEKMQNGGNAFVRGIACCLVCVSQRPG